MAYYVIVPSIRYEVGPMEKKDADILVRLLNKGGVVIAIVSANRTEEKQNDQD